MAETTKPWNKKIAVAVSATVKTRADKSLSSFTLHDEIASRHQDFAMLDRNEIKVGELLGTGGFSEVYEVAAIQTKRSRVRRRNHEATQMLQQSLLDPETNRPRFAIKFLKPGLFEQNPGKFCVAAAELVVDAYFLSALSHPNVASIHGLAASGIAGYGEVRQHDGNFLLLERLECTLEDRIEAWVNQQIKIETTLSGHERHLEQLMTYVERTRVLEQVAAGLDYIHSKNIIFRDLKPSNIGFDARGTAKVFDFGIARELPRSSLNPADTHAGDEEGFDMTGKVGTIRYMAPECLLKSKYNAKADVYGFGLVMYEAVSLIKPFAAMSKDEIRFTVCEKEERPPLPSNWPEFLRDLINRAWSGDFHERPTMAFVHNRLKDVIQEYEAEVTDIIMSS